GTRLARNQALIRTTNIDAFSLTTNDAELEMAEPRIISLIASATEIVCALGFESQMVGRSHECDFPVSVKRLPVCTSPKFEVEGLTYQTDERVKPIFQQPLSL